MTTKKILVSAALILISIVGVKAYAYARLSKEEKVKRITDKMARKLSLSEDQKAKVFQINLARANGHEKAYRLGRNKDVIRDAVSKWEADLKLVLTSEQTQKLKI